LNSLDRIQKLRQAAFKPEGYDGYLIFNGVNQLYFLGFPGTSALLVPSDGECIVYVYGVNYEQAKALGKGFDVRLVRADENLMARVAAEAKSRKISKLAIDSLGVDAWGNLTKDFPGAEVNGAYVWALRMVKYKEEIELMRKAGELTSAGMAAACESVKVGAKEYEVAAEIEYAMRKRGAGPTAFESIVASGACSAFPHGGCTGREIRDGDLVVVDIGATYNYYCSDMTRTFVAGKPKAKQQRIYDTVKAAHDKAFKAVKAGLPVADLDATARKLIGDAGFGEYFVHRLGHGVGLEVHEPPSMGVSSKEMLAVGNVVTDEPGIYIPGFGGVRIEDTVLVGKDGGEKLTIGSYCMHA
jgi:Xaa-Pro aminopeptidase